MPIKVAVVIPTRCDRPQLLEHGMRLLAAQSVQPDRVIIVNDPAPDSTKKDITWRYRVGCERAFADQSIDLAICWEDDDWYSPDYIKIMSNQWQALGRPVIMGIGNTYYYHLKLKKWVFNTHQTRASMFTTVLSREVLRDTVKWPDMNYAFTDIALWKQLMGPTFTLLNPIAIGIKGYNEGRLFGGLGHTSHQMYKNSDPNMQWLGNIVGLDSLDFYKKIAG